MIPSDTMPCTHRVCHAAKTFFGDNIGGPEEKTSIINLRHLDPPPSWESLAVSLPVIEIGFGKGRFLLTSSQLHPEMTYIGIEHTLKMVRVTAERLLKQNIQNVRLIWGDADKIVQTIIPDHAVFAYHIYFPDPWPKRKHHKRRLFSKAFVRHLERTLTSQGMFHFATDVKDYFDETTVWIQNETKLIEIPTPPDFIPTHYELKYRKEGRAIYRTTFVRV